MDSERFVANPAGEGSGLRGRNYFFASRRVPARLIAEGAPRDGRLPRVRSLPHTRPARRPGFVASDEEPALLSAIQATWPGITHRVAWDKLDLQLEKKMTRASSKVTLWRAKGKWSSRGQSPTILRDLKSWTAFT